MGDATPDKILPWCTCIMGVLATSAVIAWLPLNRHWRNGLRGMTFSTVSGKIRMALWILGVIAVGIYNVFILRVFVFYFALVLELFRD